MSYKYAVGIDIGTHYIKVAIVESGDNSQKKPPRIIGTGHAESKGLKQGYVLNAAEVQESVQRAILMAEKAAGFKVKEALLAIGSISLDSIVGSGSIIVSRGDGEVTENDVERLNEATEHNLPGPEIINKRVLHTIPQQYLLDGRILTGSPVGLSGVKLESRILYITCFEQHLNDLIDAIEGTGITVIDVIAAPLAAGLVTLTPAQRMVGSILANIGSETVTVAAYENNLPISITVFPIGSNDITKDIALGLKISLEEAEQLKLGSVVGQRVPRRKLQEIIDARLTDIFELISAHLKKIGKQEILPAGIILTGGGASSDNIENLAKNILQLPAKIADFRINTKQGQTNTRDTSWAVAYGLGIIGLSQSEDQTLGINHSKRPAAGRFFKWAKQFLP